MKLAIYIFFKTARDVFVFLAVFSENKSLSTSVFLDYQLRSVLSDFQKQQIKRPISKRGVYRAEQINACKIYCSE